MSKAILVLDEMPKSCYDCELFDIEWAKCCAKWLDTCGDKRPRWCPLKPLEYYDEVMERIHRLEKEMFE